MEQRKSIPVAEFYATYNTRTGVHKDAIFGARKALMEEIYATGIPIYCDQSYYHHAQQVDLVEKKGEHFSCELYTTNFEEWRDCHYYSQLSDAAGNLVWLMTGGRYD